ncbi:MAG: hypothetical protein ABIF19_01600 [Planctomycetota bacterium]
MIGKIGRFFEEHIEKIILVIVGLVCAFLLITRVILSPNVVEYAKEKFSPGAVDNHIFKEAQALGQKLGEPPEDMEPYKPRVGEFLALLDSSVRGVDVSLWPAVPSEVRVEPTVAGVYRLPEIGEVNDVAVGHIRAVAYIPLDPITPETPYDKAGNEANDLDFITVEAKFDIQGLFERFKENFMVDVEPQWADPCFAKPVFAAVHLQRQEVTAEGTWSDWRDVPRTRIDRNAKLFQIIEDVKDLPPGGMKVQLLQFDYKDVQIDLLQPESYQIASAREEWLPPSLHKEFVEFQRKEMLEERRQAKEDAKEQRQQEVDQRRTRRTDTGIGGAGGRGGGGYDQFGGAGAGSGGSTRDRDRSRDRSSTTTRSGTTGGPLGDAGTATSRRRSGSRRTGDSQDALYDLGGEFPGATAGRRDPRRPSVNDVYFKYDQIALNRLTDFAKMREPLVFWAHDDTVEPEKTYRYRIRLGVFNPAAGQNLLGERDKSRNNQVVLWSDFSDTTEPVDIMGRLYFFANHMREADKTVTVEVAKLTLGQWYSEDFPVKEGEVIGHVKEVEPPKPERRPGSAVGGGYSGYPGAVGALGATGPGVGAGGRSPTLFGPEQQSQIPETVNYGTGAVVVDAVAVNDWSGDKSLRMRHYYDMLYSYDGTNIRHMPVGSTYWPTELQSVYSLIGRLQREPQEPFKAFGSSSGRQRRGGLDQGMEYYDDMGMYEDTMMEDMGGGFGGRRR